VFINVAFVLGLAVRVSASIHRISEDVVECGVSGDDPSDGTRYSGRCGLQRKRQTFRTKPEPDPSCRAEFVEPLEDRADRAGDGFIRMKEDFPILFSPDEAHGQAAPQFSASGFVADAAVQPGAKDVQLGFAHCALEAEQKAIVEQRRVIDAVVVANESIGDAAQFEQAIPVGVVSSQARHFQSEDDAHVSQRDFAGEASKPGALVGAGAG
jgi:hypothetical protein